MVERLPYKQDVAGSSPSLPIGLKSRLRTVLDQARHGSPKGPLIDFSGRVMAKRVQVVLNKAVNKLGHPGDVVDVAPGYARNYLLPLGLALQPTPGILKQAERRRAIELQRLAELKQQSEAQKAVLDAAKGLSIAKQVGENGAIFGTVTNQDVADAIKAVTSLEIDRRTISVPDIHTLGSYTADIKLHSEVTATVNFEVVAS